jgi:Cu(I)/Ag(I) efflux system membrane protein CusA/SilA
VIERLIAWCARNRALTVTVVLVAAVFGFRALRNAPLDAIPDLSDTQVIVSTEWMGRSPDIIEDQVTYPIVTALRGVPGVQYVRGLSMIGDSFVYIVFKDGVDLYWARSRVLEYLSAIQGRLPEGVTPKLGPDATSVGWVFEYALVDTTGQNDLSQIRSFQDWSLRYWLQSVDGVSEVASVGGFVKQYQVDLDPDRLESYKVSLQEVAEAIRRSNNEVGGSVLEIGEHEHFVRGRGYIRSLSDLESIPVKLGPGGVPVTLRNLGEVHLGPEQRRGIVELNGKGEVVGGIVIMRQRQNALRVIDGVKRRLDEVRRSFPPGVKLVVTYDRSELIHRAVNTLGHEVILEMLIVSAVIVFFLYHLRSALIPILTLPIAVVLAFLPLAGQGLTANIMSLGGNRRRDRSHGGCLDHHGGERPPEAGRLGNGRTRGPARGRRDRRASGSWKADLLCPGRDHRFLPSGVHAARDGGPPLQAPRVHQDIFDGVRARSGRDTDPGARVLVDPRPDP